MRRRRGWEGTPPALVAALALVVGCAEPAAPGAPALAREASSLGELTEALEAAGASVEIRAESVTSLFSVPGRLVLVDGAQIEVFVFPDAAAAEEEVPRLTQSLIHWMAPARLFGRGALLVLYVGPEGPTTELLERVLGPALATAGAS